MLDTFRLSPLKDIQVLDSVVHKKSDGSSCMMNEEKRELQRKASKPTYFVTSANQEVCVIDGRCCWTIRQALCLKQTEAFSQTLYHDVLTQSSSMTDHDSLGVNPNYAN